MIRTLGKALYFTRILAGYGCAGDPACDATFKCGPCEAREWLDATAALRNSPQPRRNKPRKPLKTLSN